MLRSLLAIAVLLQMNFGIRANEVPSLIDREGLKLTAEIIGDPPLPFQAVRLRMTLENVGAKTRAGLLLPEDAVRVDAIQMPGGSKFEERLFDIATDLRERGPNCGAMPHARMPITLKPGEFRSVSFALSTHRIADAKEPLGSGAVPLFPVSGDYIVRVRYLLGTKSVRGGPAAGGWNDEVWLDAPIKVCVGNPAARDKPWLEAIAKSPKFGSMLIRPDTPCTVEEALLARQLTEKFPTSTYANYGRLAVGRHHYVGSLDPKKSLRVNHALAADVLEESISRIEYFGFPYMPHVYLLLQATAAEHKNSATATLSRDYRDAWEWIEASRTRLNAEEWQKFRAPMPMKLKAKP